MRNIFCTVPVTIWDLFQMLIKKEEFIVEYRLGEVEMKFAEIIWEKEPVSSGELVKLANERLGWKKSTTYTIIKRLSDKGIFTNEKGTVTSNISRQEFQVKKTEQFVEENFDGSLPDFVAAFVSRKSLSDAEIKELTDIIRGKKKK